MRFYNSAGTIVASYQYDAFGNCTITRDDAGIAALNPIRYRGYYYDSETGLYYLQSRYYNPQVGRFLNADSQLSGVGGDVNGYNMFSYCQNNPVNMSDPTGHWPGWIEELASRFIHTVKIMGRIAMSPLKALTAEVGAGIGIGAKAAVNVQSVPVEIGAVASITDSVSYEKGTIDVRNTTSINVGINIAEVFDFSHTNGYQHSYFDDNCTCDFMNSTFGEKGKCIANQRIFSNDATLELSVGMYFMLGAEASISVDLGAWNDELISIYHESLSYGK